MSGRKKLRTNFIIWLLIVAIGLSTVGCNSGNHSNKRLAINNRIAKHREEKKAGGLGGVINGLGKTIEGTAKVALAVVVVGGVVIGSLYLDHQVQRLQDNMFSRPNKASHSIAITEQLFYQLFEK
jgi:hypothetical protein